MHAKTPFIVSDDRRRFFILFALLFFRFLFSFHRREKRNEFKNCNPIPYTLYCIHTDKGDEKDVQACADVQVYRSGCVRARGGGEAPGAEADRAGDRGDRVSAG